MWVSSTSLTIVNERKVLPEDWDVEAFSYSLDSAWLCLALEACRRSRKTEHCDVKLHSIITTFWIRHYAGESTICRNEFSLAPRFGQYEQVEPSCLRAEVIEEIELMV
ncbi:hypothetical protein KC335_g23 [Hortaea werneckii]|nr:hypothetical protein KC335_g23 [Hortaea werneckii]